MAKTQDNMGKSYRKSKSYLPKVILAVAFLGLASFGGFYFFQYQTVNDKYQEATLSVDDRNKRTTNEVAKLIDLPKDETPIVYVVKDKDKLTTTKSAKEFFENAKNDDIVLAYQKGDTAIIYRPSEKRIVKTDSYQKFVAASSPATIAIIAPTSTQDSIAGNLEQKVSNAQIVTKLTPKVPLTTGIVVDLSGTEADDAKTLAEILGYTVGQLPEGEQKPEGVTFIVIAPTT